eukprot:3451371-Prymnesium_polylepis.1
MNSQPPGYGEPRPRPTGVSASFGRSAVTAARTGEVGFGGEICCFGLVRSLVRRKCQQGQQQRRAP